MGLKLSHANLPSCEDCQKYLYDHKHGWRQKFRDERRGTKSLPILRDADSVLPCHVRECPKVPRGADPGPQSAIELSERNAQAWWYYDQCGADTTGLLPRDQIIIRNNALIRRVMDANERGARDNLNQLLATILTAKA